MPGDGNNIRYAESNTSLHSVVEEALILGFFGHSSSSKNSYQYLGFKFATMLFTVIANYKLKMLLYELLLQTWLYPWDCCLLKVEDLIGSLTNFQNVLKRC